MISLSDSSSSFNESDIELVLPPSTKLMPKVKIIDVDKSAIEKRHKKVRKHFDAAAGIMIDNSDAD